jgi:hypothetical protein
MFTILFTEGGNPLCEREWPIVPRIGDTLTLRDSDGLFEVIRVKWDERDDSLHGLIAYVSLRANSR